MHHPFDTPTIDNFRLLEPNIDQWRSFSLNKTAFINYDETIIEILFSSQTQMFFVSIQQMWRWVCMINECDNH